MRAPLLAAAALLAAALPAAADPVVLPGTESFEMTAAATGHRYRIYLAHPVKPAPSAGFPVLYFLDGDAIFGTAAEAMRIQTRGPKGFEGAAVVAIGYGGGQPFDSAARYRDYTTPAEARNLPRRSNGKALPANGGAEAFLDFIASELMPEIARRLPVDPARATLVGHSLGGFLALHAFLDRPGLFSTVVAGSPSVWWNQSELLGRAREVVAAPPDLAGRKLFIGVGARELPDMRDGAAEMAEALAPLRARGLDLAFREFPEEEHTSVIPALIGRAFAVSLESEAPGD